ncbi:agmatinase [Roseobacter sp. HKCCD9010]|uniref:arginase family protein n=1 Tax=unclassified Roseobacter TaxID=196798 RepID=UPI001490D817|nr:MULTISPECIES: arginase family protein [unclassified Roseobacter]MBF9051695.1 agmatinase [Rhodobacterales bacterium HKCCD4356]NNV13219.1 agmatinase [Roseobacter sp. HKCCD7357]NNV17470.1 agmatinase [Roseobacter sp. HKCCD8768]NNV27076.1 agmatinase [Roseobacter sp. HKCCD8192]NNV31196.1 agmatinase [Roseobacter sp. HKCCD9061]
MADQHLTSMMDNLYWWGIPTMFRCPNASAEGADIALVGVPHSTGNGTTERDQHLGPRALRNVSAVSRRVHGAFGIDPWAAAKIVDVGDVPLPRANDNEACIADITAFYKEIDAAGARPVSVGGDHSITGGIVQALGQGQIADGEPVCFLHLDAHTDVFTKVDHFLGAKKSAAHWGAYLADQGQVDPHHSMQIGLRGHPRTLDWLQPSYDYGYNVVTMAEFRSRGLADVVAQIKEVLAGRPVYITFDLDCLDPTIAPGVSNLEPGERGFDIDEAVALLRAVRGMNIIGGDIVCMMPTKDSPNQITALTATAVMFEMISMIAETTQTGE